MSLLELSQKTGIDVKVLQLYENGEKKPRAKELHRIAQEIKIPILALIHGGGDFYYLERDENGKTSERLCRY